MTTEHQTQSLLLDLETALKEAYEWGFEATSPSAIVEAEGLLRAIQSRAAVSDAVEVAVGEDGSIEITASDGAALIIVDIPPSGSRIEMVVQDWQSGEILTPAASVTRDNVVERIERGG